MAESADEEASIQASTPGERIWGPVPEAQAVAAGALAAASSVLIAPQVAPVQLYQRLTALVPDEVLPKASDTAHTLRLRLAASAFLHPTQVSAKGHGRGGRYVALNDTTYPHPRRVQWATPTVPEHTDPDGDRVVQCLCYPHYYTKSPLLRMVEVMPPAIDELITFAVQLARPVLTPPSLAQRPNSCELCIYYTAFGSKMGPTPRQFCVARPHHVSAHTGRVGALQAAKCPAREQQRAHPVAGQRTHGAAALLPRRERT